MQGLPHEQAWIPREHGSEQDDCDKHRGAEKSLALTRAGDQRWDDRQQRPLLCRDGQAECDSRGHGPRVPREQDGGDAQCAANDLLRVPPPQGPHRHRADEHEAEDQRLHRPPPAPLRHTADRERHQRRYEQQAGEISEPVLRELTASRRPRDRHDRRTQQERERPHDRLRVEEGGDVTAGQGVDRRSRPVAAAAERPGIVALERRAEGRVRGHEHRRRRQPQAAPRDGGTCRARATRYRGRSQRVVSFSDEPRKSFSAHVRHGKGREIALTWLVFGRVRRQLKYRRFTGRRNAGCAAMRPAPAHVRVGPLAGLAPSIVSGGAGWAERERRDVLCSCSVCSPGRDPRRRVSSRAPSPRRGASRRGGHCGRAGARRRGPRCAGPRRR